MPASTFARPAQLHLCSVPSRFEQRAPWSAGSDSDDEDETTSADSNEDADDSPTFDGPSASTSSHTMPMRRAPALPAITVSSRSISPPRRSPLSPLAAGAGASATGSAARPVRPVRLGMSPLSPTGAASRPLGLPKATPLSRTLLNRSMSSSAQKPKKTTKFIVPSKPFRSTFELGLTSTELKRK